MRIQRQSEGIRKGDQNPDHVLGMKLATEYIEKHKRNAKWYVFEGEWVEKFDWVFMYFNLIPDEHYDGYKPDIVVYETVVVRGRTYQLPVFIVEIDGPKHDKVEQKIKDRMYEKWIYYHYNDVVEVVRLRTAEMNGSLDLALDYIRKELMAYCR